MGEVFHNFADAAPLAQAALDREGLTSLFDRYDWFARTHAECPLVGAPLIAHASDDGVDTWLFLTRDGRGRAAGMASWYTLAFRPVFKGNPNAQTRASLLKTVATQLRDHATMIDLAPMHADDCQLTAQAFARAGWITVAQQTGWNWTVDVAGKSFAEYWAARPGQLRKTVKVKRAKAGMDVQILNHFDAVAWAEYEAVYADSWKPEEGAVHFLRRMAETEGAAGTLRLGIGRIGGQAVAAQLWTCENSTAIAHKVAHRQSATAYSPGSLLSAAMFEHVIDIDNVRCVDFGTGDSPYKTAWMEARAPLFTLSLFNKNSVTAVLRATKAKALEALRVGTSI
jgi:hypothetical protein